MCFVFRSGFDEGPVLLRYISFYVIYTLFDLLKVLFVMFCDSLYIY